MGSCRYDFPNVDAICVFIPQAVFFYTQASRTYNKESVVSRISFLRQMEEISQ